MISASAVACLALSAVGTSACVPIPHRERQTPVVLGSLTTSGVPVAGVTVRVATIDEDPAPACSGKHVLDGTTDAEGRFQFQPIQQLTWSVFIGGIAHRFYEFEVCVRQDDGWIRLVRDKVYAAGDTVGGGPLGALGLTCESSKSVRRVFTCNRSRKLD